MGTLYNVPTPAQVYLGQGDSGTELSTFCYRKNHDDMAKTQNQTLQSEVHSILPCSRTLPWFYDTLYKS